ncbi:MAG: sulfotransferase [Ardenticatenaceae bacterium]|nr:sulfotransferase [Ardenticatenaceae bacterium]
MYKQIKKNLRSIVLRNYLAGRFDERDVFILTSSPRSGSTLLGQILGAIPDSCTLFEPLHLRNVPEAEAAGFSWRTFVPRDEKWIEGEAYLKRVFEGRIVNDWTAREISFRQAYKSKRLIVKFVRANRLLPWICQNFEIPAPILLLRHPCAVIASQLNYGWENAKRPDIPPYLGEYPVFQTSLAETEGNEEYLAALWALDQLPVLMEQAPHPWIIITYEELLLRPESVLLNIREKWDVEFDTGDALSRLKRPSSVVSRSGISGINGWKNTLSEKQISRVLSTVNSFGLPFYSDNDEADYGELYSTELAKHIKKAGIG